MDVQGPGLLFSWIVMAPSQYRVHCLGSVDFKGFDVRCQIVLQNASSSLEQRMENCVLSGPCVSEGLFLVTCISGGIFKLGNLGRFYW